MSDELTTIRETDLGFNYWLSRPYVDDKLRGQLSGVNLLLVPQEGFRDHKDPLFPVGTEGFFHFFRDKHPPEVKPDICIKDEDYQELALHADWLILAGVVVTTFVAPIAVNLISEYLKKRLWPTESKRGIKFQMIVQENLGDQSRAVEISYEGPADQFSSTMHAAFDNLKNKTGEETLQQAGMQVLPDPQDKSETNSDGSEE